MVYLTSLRGFQSRTRSMYFRFIPHVTGATSFSQLKTYVNFPL